jgi:hypothetical protein
MLNDEVQFYWVLFTTMLVGVNLLFAIRFIKNATLRFGLSISVVLLISFVTGIRGEGIGLDTSNYSFYYKVSEKKFYEPIFNLIFSVFNLFSSDVVFVFLFINLLINLLFLLAAKNVMKNDYPIVMAIYFSSFIFVNVSINIIRQGLAIAFFIYALSLLICKRRKISLLFMTTSILTHFSSFFAMISYFFRNKYRSNKVLLILITVILLFSLIKFSDLLLPITHINPIVKKLHWYLSWQNLKPWHLKHYYYLVLGLIMVYLIFRRKMNVMPLNLMFLFYCVGFTLVFAFREEEMVADRTFYYFFFVGFYLILGIKKIVKEKMAYYFILLLLINIWLFKTMYLQYPKWFIYPYEAIR